MPEGDSFRRPRADALGTQNAPSTSPAAPRKTHAGPQSRQELDAFSEAFVRCLPRALNTATEILLDALPPVDDGEILDGAAAYEYMIDLRRSLSDAATQVAQYYDSETWLHLIRRLSPHALPLGLSGSTEYAGDSTQRVAENIVGAAGTARLDVESGSFSVDASMRLARLMTLASMIDNLEGAIRSATKGVKYLVSNRRRPRPHDSDSLIEALREFDLRSSWGSPDDTPRLGEVDPDLFDEEPPMLVAYRFKHGTAIDQVWAGAFRESRIDQGAVQFTVRSFVIQDEARIMFGPHGTLSRFDDPRAIASLIVFGNALLRLVLNDAEDAGASLPSRGILQDSTESLTAQIRSVLDSSVVADWLAGSGQASLTSEEVLNDIRATYAHDERSFPGRILHEHRDHVTVDVWAYTWHVTHQLKLSPHTCGAIANFSAEQFELAAQEKIDSSVLAPAPALRELRGRTLRLNGRPITDIDAVLTAGNTLFLISCKNFATSVRYMAGEYAAARNGTTRLNAALDEWSDRISTFRASPIGDNYDFSGYVIEGFVLLPQLFFTPRSDAREILRWGRDDVFFTRVESFSQFSAALTMCGWDTVRPASDGRTEFLDPVAQYG